MSAKVKNGLTKKHLFGYGMGDLGGCMTFALMGSYATRYYTNVLQVDPKIMAVLLLIWNVWDAVNDPMMGAIMDKIYAKNHNKRGKFRPWILRSAPLVTITAIVFWTVPTFFEGTALLVVLFFCKILYEGCYTMFNIPMGSMISAMSETDEERASLSSARGFGSAVGNLLPAMIFPTLLAKYGDSNKIGYAIGATMCAVIGFVFCMLHYKWTEERFVSNTTGDGSAKMTDILGVFRKNRPFVALCIHGICICCMNSVNNTLSTYIYADVFHNIGIMKYVGAMGLPLTFIVLLVAPKLAKRLGLERMIRYGLLIGSTMYVSLFVMHMTMEVNVYFHMIWTVLALGISSASINMQWGLVSETIDYNEMVTGRRTEGSIYGTFNLTRRIGTTIGNSAAVFALGMIGYDASIAASGGVQTAGTIIGIKALCVLVPGLFVLGSWASFKFVWNITPEIRKKILAYKEAQRVSDKK